MLADLIFLAFVAAAVVDWIAVAQQHQALEWIAKPAALALLLLWAAMGDAPSWALLAALAFSLLGDVYLMLPANLFVAGLAAFLVGHLAYIDAFHAPLGWRVIWSALVLGASAPLGLRIVGAVPSAPLRIAVAAYMIVIAVMTGSAIAAGLPLAVVGALLFMLSDSMIAWNRFVAPFAGARLAIIVTYHVGQALLVHALRS
ncbi:lysoplasmalogenase [bacterium]|nr:lysoplasmalogenase [bacterium]